MSKDVHNFHLVLNSSLKYKIIQLSKKLKLSKSNTMIYIINKTICILNKYQFELPENKENLNYQKVNWDTDIHIYMSNDLFRKIKHLSNTIFSFSIAIIIRKLLELYFRFFEKSKGDIKRVEKLLKRFYLMHVKKYGNTIKKWNKKIQNEQLSGKFYYYIKFNEKFAITGFNFNNSF